MRFWNDSGLLVIAAGLILGLILAVIFCAGLATWLMRIGGY